MTRSRLLGLGLGVAASSSPSPPASAEEIPVSGPTTWTVTGHGWGHGHGLSQYGAHGAANQGLGGSRSSASTTPAPGSGGPTAPIKILHHRRQARTSWSTPATGCGCGR